MLRRLLPIGLLAGLCLYLAALTFYQLDAFPALHGDEAWVGLFAQRLRTRGLYTPHEMNTYTGPLYGWLVAKWFTAFSVNVFYLRLTGALLNLLAVWAMAGHLFRRVGRDSALAWTYLLATSALFLYAARIAWEVCALQAALLTALFIVSRLFLDERRYPFGAVAAFLAAVYIGVWNHFIFLSVPVSLGLAAFYNLMFYRDWPRLRFFQLALWSLLLSALVYLLKPPLTEAFWQAHILWLLPLCLAAPFIFAALFGFVACWSESAVRAVMERLAQPRPREYARRVFIVGLLVFFAYHVVPLVQIGSNVLIFKRTASWQPPLIVSAVLHVWAAAILGACLLFAYRSLPVVRFSALRPYERLLVFWPVVHSVIHIIFRHTSSIRYYIIPAFLFMVSAAFVLPRLPALRRRAVLAAGLLVAVMLNGFYWAELTSPAVRRPLRFRIGWRLEKSADFLSKRAVHEIIEKEKICVLDQDESMIDLPIFFTRKSHDCAPGRSIAVRYCWDCERPPYFTWIISDSP
ncbi:MAG: hypothetical protein ABIJ96_15730 [Elusimicrobiota bacterium]